MEDKKEHLKLPFVGEFSCGPKYVCKVCGEKLVTEKSEKTNWQELVVTDKRFYSQIWKKVEECDIGQSVKTLLPITSISIYIENTNINMGRVK